MGEGKRLQAVSVGLAAIILMTASGPVVAQTTATGQTPADRIPAASAPAGNLDTGAPGVCPFAGQGLTVTLSRVTVEGATVIDQGAIDAAVAPLLNRQTGLEVVCAARDRVADLFASRGYRLTRIDVPPQRLASGELRLVATEGYVASADVDGLEPMGPSGAVAREYFANIGTERPTPWSRVERAVFLAREIPGAEMAIRLNAAPDGPGAVRLTASARGRRRFDVTTGLQHMGSDELGETAAFVRLDANSFTSLAERTSLLLYATENGAQQVAELVESIAVGGQGLRAEVDLTYARTQPEGVLAPLMIEGDFFSLRAGAAYPLVRSQALSVTAGAHFEYLDQENSLGVFQSLTGGAPVLFDDKLRIVRLEADARWRPAQWRSFEGWAAGQIRQGVSGGSALGDPNLSRAEGDPEATVVRAEATGRWTFGGRPASGGLAGPWVSVTASGQWASDPLLAYEEFQIGNFTVGRGYDPGSASGDEAWAVQLEAGWAIETPLGTAEPYVFYDYADLNNLDQSGYQTEISSYGVGVRARLPWKLRLDVAWASPQDPPFPSAPEPDDRLLVSLTRVFSFR